MLYTILSIVGGLIAASSLILKKQPNARQLFERIAPYQGLLGIGLLVLGTVWLVQILPHVGSWLATAPLRTAITIAALSCTILVGFLLGYGLLSRIALSKNAAASEKGAQLHLKLVSVQAPLGLLTASLGIALLIL